MARASVISPQQQFYYPASNRVVAAGTVAFLNPGTDDFAKIYSDPELKIAQENPYTLDAGGMLRGDVRFASTLTCIVYDPDGVELEEIENVNCFSNDTAFADYSNIEIYSEGDIVTFGGNYYKSLIDGNLNNDPATNIVAWENISFIPAPDSDIEQLEEISTLDQDFQVVLIGDGAEFETAPIASLIPNYLAGMETSNAADMDHDITVQPGTCADSTSLIALSLDSAITKQIDATWAAGNNAGGLAGSLTLASNTWYNVFVVKTALVTDVMFDTSVVCANGVANNSVTHFRRIGSFLTSGSANIIGFHQFGNYFYLDAVFQVYNQIGPDTTGTLIPMRSPLGVVCNACLAVNTTRVAGAGATSYVLLTSGEQTNSVPASTINILAVTEQAADNAYGTYCEVETNTSSQVRIREVSAIPIQTRINSIGWFDTRGQ